LDFWATWCGPCRIQHPLYDQVKKRFAKDPSVVFLAISTDEERDLVKPFLESQKWSTRVYFEDGLSLALRISSIPTTILLDRRGGISTRMNGFDPDSFVETLTARIDEALK
jgi:thiol-disulfide isomerase/thioredoxin